MRAAVLRRFNDPLTVEDLQVLPLGPFDVRVRTLASGVCHTDLLTSRGRLLGQDQAQDPLVLGHEGTGVVAEVGPAVDSLAVGDTVVATWVAPCLRCFWCVRGQSEYCVTGRDRATRFTTTDDEPVVAGIGTFSEVMVASARSFVRVDSDLPPSQLALLGCGVATGAGAVLHTARVRPGDSVAIVGCGGVGLAAVQAARIAGASQIIAVDPASDKGAMAREFGATHHVDPTDEEAVGAVRAIAHGRGVDVAFEMAGRPASCTTAWKVTRRGGMLVLVGAQPGNEPPSWGTYDWIRSGITVVGGMYGSSQVHRDIPRLARMAEAGQFDLAAMVSRTVDLDDVNEALATIGDGDVVRTVIAVG